MTSPALYLLPVPLGDTPPEAVLPVHNGECLQHIHYFVVENVRSARRFLASLKLGIDLDAISLVELNEHTPHEEVSAMLDPLREGHDMGIISEAGLPAVADPGADLVAVAQREGRRVVPLVGPSSLMLSLMASGLNGQCFAFHGYLPIDDNKRQQRLRQLETRAYQEGETQLFIETPYRNQRLFETLLCTLRPATRLCVAVSVTCADELIHTRTIAEWKRLWQVADSDARARLIPRQPALFLFNGPAPW